MAVNFARLKYVDEKGVVLVSGYMRRLVFEEELCPRDIINIIVLFMQMIERFVKATTSNSIKVSSRDRIFGINDIAIINHSQDVDWSAMRGALQICCDKKEQNCIYEWTFYIKAPRVIIGIFSPGKADRCCLTNAFEARHLNGVWTYKYKRDYDVEINYGDEIKMLFNSSKGILSFHRNQIDLGIAHDDIDISRIYCMVVFFKGGEPGDYVEIDDCSVSKVM